VIEDTAPAGASPGAERAPRRLRADAQRNVGSLLEAAKAVFATSGVDAPAKEIADLAGVGVGTLYRHFPQRSDLVKAVFQREVDACADAAQELAAAYQPEEALARWLHRYTEYLAAKRGLAPALHSGDPAYRALPGYFRQRLGPALGSLLEAAIASGEVRADISAKDLLDAVGNLCLPVADQGPTYSQRMVALLIDGLRYGTGRQSARVSPGNLKLEALIPSWGVKVGLDKGYLSVLQKGACHCIAIGAEQPVRHMERVDQRD